MKFALESGREIPAVGLGTYQLRGTGGREAVVHALQLGYRHIDTAQFYRNEEMIGEALKNSAVDRQEMFVASKVWTSSLGYNQTDRAFEESLRKLQLDYIDLYLIHWPGSDRSKRLESYRRMMELREEGRIGAVGVSNFSTAQLDEIYQKFGEYPEVNQVLFNPFETDSNLLNFCRESHIQLVAYTPLNKGRNLDQGVLKSIAAKYQKTPAQICLRWALDQGIVVIPKSSSPSRMRENMDVLDFALSSMEIEEISGLNN